MAKKGGKRKAGVGRDGVTVATNRSAAYRYHLSDKLEAGMVLLGTEVKALRGGKATIKDGYVSLDHGELWLHNVHIPPYENAARDNHEPERPRKLLAKRSEIERLATKVAAKGFTLVPTRIYFSGAHAKVEIALARGKDAGDKRQTIKERDMRREMDRAMSER